MVFPYIRYGFSTHSLWFLHTFAMVFPHLYYGFILLKINYSSAILKVNICNKEL